MSMTTATSTLSKAASAIYRIRADAWMDYQMDGSDDCGDLIAASHRRFELKTLAEHGYATPGAYNAALRRALGAGDPDGQGRTTMSYHAWTLLQVLEVEACLRCGGAIETEIRPTRQYGGGYDTYEHCACGYAEVYV